MFFNATLPTLLKSNPKQFWNIVRTQNTSTIALTTSKGGPVPSRLCTSVLNDTFVTAFSSSRTLPGSPELRSKDYFSMDPIIFNATGISAIVKKLKPKSSCGVDEINSKILKNAHEYCSIILECIFSQSYHLHALPQDWTTK